jgi:hypothetical protein
VGVKMAQRVNFPDDIFPCKDCVLIVHPKYANNKIQVNDSMNRLLIYVGSKTIKREPIRKMSPGYRDWKDYFSYEMNSSRGGDLNELIIG